MIRGNLVIEAGGVIGTDLDCGYNVVLREGCILGDRVKIWSNSVIDAGAEIGDETRVHCNVYISQGCTIGSQCFIGPGVRLLNDKFPPRFTPESWEPVHLRDGVILGGGVIVLPGVEIGEGAFIGAGSVVTKSVPAGELWVGNPARCYRARGEWDSSESTT